MVWILATGMRSGSTSVAGGNVTEPGPVLLNTKFHVIDTLAKNFRSFASFEVSQYVYRHCSNATGNIGHTKSSPSDVPGSNVTTLATGCTEIANLDGSVAVTAGTVNCSGLK